MLSIAGCARPQSVSTKPTEATFYTPADIDWFYQVKTHPGAACTLPDSVWNNTVEIANRMLKLDAYNRRQAAP